MQPITSNLRVCMMVPEGVWPEEQLRKVIEFVNNDEYILKKMAMVGINFTLDEPLPTIEISQRDYQRQVRCEILQFIGKGHHNIQSASQALNNVVTGQTLSRIIKCDPTVMYSTMRKVHEALLTKKGLVLS